MTKIMLVEDDNNLREIYQARLAAEGFTIVAAEDGEAALALAAKERPDLIITDVMMPKISGFEMLDILRNTESLHDVKVIMLTALGQAEDNARAGALGADRYLVKSQVTLEDIVKTTHDLVDEPTGEPAAQTPTPETVTSQEVPSTPPTNPSDEMTPPPVITEPLEATVIDQPVVVEPPTATSDVTVEPQVKPALPSPIDVVEPPRSTNSDDVSSPDMSSDSAEPVIADSVQSDVDTAAPATQEESQIRDQIDQFLNQSSEPETTSEPNVVVTLPDEGESEFAKDDSTPDMGELNIQSSDGVPQDEDESEFAKDDSTPDLGELAIQAPMSVPQDEPPIQPAADASAAPVTPTPGYPSQSYELPTIPGAAVTESSPSAADQSSGDQIVSDAIDTMIASTGQQSATQPATEMPVAALDPASQPVGTPPSEDPGTGATVDSDSDHASGSVHSRFITPLGIPTRPDINQLLSMEEAKAAATQAGAQQPPAAVQPDPNQGIDPNSISL